MTRTPTPRPGRGRPVVFDAALRTRYLAAVTAGMPLREAAAHVGLGVVTPRLHARSDPEFGRALAAAKTAGKHARAEAVPHGESRYTNYGCRCTICKGAATAARTARRSEARATVGEVVNLPPGEAGAPPFPLARAS